MNIQGRSIARIAIAAIVASYGIAGFARSTTLVKERPMPPVRIDANGTLRIAAITAIPPSEFWSPEFKQAYLQILNQVLTRPFSAAPAASAPKAEWDKSDAEFDHFMDPYLAWDKEHYPVDVVDTKIAGVRVGVITPKDGVAPENEHRVLINVHGGAFIFGRGLAMGQIESIPLASIGRIEVITLDYRQAPYYKFPAATEDVLTVYRDLLRRYRPTAIGIFGSSAGGVLTAQALAAFAAQGLPRPGAVGIFWAAPGPFWSPLFTKQGDSMMWDRVLDRAVRPRPRSNAPVNYYMEGTDPSDPLANPGSSDATLRKFPPTLFITGTRAADMSPAIVTHARLLKLGVDSSLYVIEGGIHAVEQFAPGTPEQVDVDTYKARWFDQHLGR